MDHCHRLRKAVLCFLIVFCSAYSPTTSAADFCSRFKESQKGNESHTTRKITDGTAGECELIDSADINQNAQYTHRVPELRKEYTLTGIRIVVGVWDEGAIAVNHQEFGNRAKIGDKPSYWSGHGTHVAGTIAAKGDPISQAQGMAPDASIRSYDWNNDLYELCRSSRSADHVDRIVISNHSYGYPRGWDLDESGIWMWYGDPDVDKEEDHLFGKYNKTAQSFDAVAFSAPNLIIFVAAGNDRDIGSNDPYTVSRWWSGTHKVANTGQIVADRRHSDLRKEGGYDTIAGAALAKNTITVGAIEDIKRGSIKPSDIWVTKFSSWGPADDGRIKPDIVANGADLFSPSVPTQPIDRPVPGSKYCELPGTSMASPTAAGIAVLLNELAIRKRGRTLKSDEMKAVLIHTALNSTPGPNYRTGWGSILADEAGDVVAGNRNFLHRGKIGDSVIEWRAEPHSGKSIRVTLVWTDPAGRINATKCLDDKTPALINDLDMEVISPAGEVYHPWSLDPKHPSKAAVHDRPNRVDNVERIDISSDKVVSGAWRLRIKPARVIGEQAFAIAVKGLILRGI